MTSASGAKSYTETSEFYASATIASATIIVTKFVARKFVAAPTAIVVAIPAALDVV